ncbi:MAG: peptidylprolyl isomerase [Alphaproteobacteria bacterium]
MRRFGFLIGGLTALLLGQPSLADAADPTAGTPKGAAAETQKGSAVVPLKNTAAAPAKDAAAPPKATAAPPKAADPKAAPPKAAEGAPKGSAVDTQKEWAPGDVIAKVDGTIINAEDFDAALSRAARQRYYHGKIDPNKLVELRRVVVDELIDEQLLLREADRRGVAADLADVDSKITAMDERYKDSPEWKAQRDQALPVMKERMIINSRKNQIEKVVRDVAPPDEEQLKAYYEGNKDLFTEPMRTRVALILLKVDPSAAKVTWEEAAAEAARIRAKIAAGTDFAELAKLHSGDKTAEQGGDMGYMHVGRLGAEAHQAVEKLAVGEVTEPVELLEGYALFKLLDRRPPRLRPLVDVRERAKDLYVRNKGDEAWTAFVARLRTGVSIWVNPEITAAAPTP